MLGDHRRRGRRGAGDLVAATAGSASEFMPPLDEGDLLYMPTTLPGISVTKARELLQQTDRIIATFPEVDTSSARSAAPRRRPTRRR